MASCGASANFLFDETVFSFFAPSKLDFRVNSASPLRTTTKRARAAGRKLEEGVSEVAASLTAGAASAVAAAATVATAAGVTVDPAALETAVEVLLSECSSW